MSRRMWVACNVSVAWGLFSSVWTFVLWVTHVAPDGSLLLVWPLWVSLLMIWAWAVALWVQLRRMRAEWRSRT